MDFCSDKNIYFFYKESYGSRTYQNMIHLCSTLIYGRNFFISSVYNKKKTLAHWKYLFKSMHFSLI